MPAPSDLRRKAIQAIGEILTEEDIVRLVREATGNNVYNIYSPRGVPLSALLSNTLDQLENDGTERWLLTYILIAIAQERIRRLIVATWPKTLVGLPQAEQQVESALKYLGTLLKLPLSNDLKQELRLKLKHDAFDEIRRRIAILNSRKNLHENLHELSLNLVFGELMLATGAMAPDFNSTADQCDRILAEAACFAPLPGTPSEDDEIELAWISRLQAMSSSLRSAIKASDVAACQSAVDNIQHLIKVQLPRLSADVLQAATDLSFEALTCDLPDDIEDQAAFGDLVHAVRDLKPTVLARALKHTLWQQVEDDISLVEDFFNIPGQEIADISALWFVVKRRVSWLAALDPDESWAGQVLELSDEIDDGLTKNRQLDDEIRARFETYRDLFRFRFLAIDDTLKVDCGALRKIDVPLTEILKELAP